MGSFDIHSVIYGFSDVSQRGYSAVLYLSTGINGSHHISLLSSKTKLAHLKTLSILRLELCGALLLAKLLGSSQLSLYTFNIPHVQLFTNSKIVLAWLRLPPHTLNFFLGN